jgi:hypothetical protein
MNSKIPIKTRYLKNAVREISSTLLTKDENATFVQIVAFLGKALNDAALFGFISSKTRVNTCPNILFSQEVLL